MIANQYLQNQNLSIQGNKEAANVITPGATAGRMMNLEQMQQTFTLK